MPLKKYAFMALFLLWAITPTAYALSMEQYVPEGENSVTFSDIRKAMDKAERSLDLQTDLPLSENSNSPRIEIDDFPTPKGDGKGFVQTAKIILWIAIGLAVGSLLYGLVNSRFNFSRSRRLRRKEGQADITPVATAARMEKAQVDADTLAQAKNFAQAMHLLLLQSVSEMRLRLDVSIAVSLTSREILHHLELPPQARESFSHIVRMVEISYFGPHAPSEEDYLACRHNYEILRQALEGGRQV